MEKSRVRSKGHIHSGTVDDVNLEFSVDCETGRVKLGAEDGTEVIANREMHEPSAEPGKRFVTLSVVRPSPYYDTKLTVYKFQFLVDKKSGTEELARVVTVPLKVNLN